MAAQTNALLLVDIQNDFCEGGSLAVPHAGEILPVANRLIDEAVAAGELVIASRDWHPVDHCSFATRGGPWPPHCIQDSEGAAFHPDLALPETAIRVSKGTAFESDAYSAFDGTDLAEFLRRHHVQRLKVAGLAQDVCVQATVVDALRQGFAVDLVTNGTRAVEPDKSDRVFRELADRGANLIQGD